MILQIEIVFGSWNFWLLDAFMNEFDEPVSNWRFFGLFPSILEECAFCFGCEQSFLRCGW